MEALTHIYAWRLWQVAAVAFSAVLLCAAIAWALTGLGRRRNGSGTSRRTVAAACACATALSAVALAGILRYTVWGRVSSDLHEFAWVSPYAYELVREMVMNAFLYVPLGLFLPYAFGFLAYILSVGRSGCRSGRGGPKRASVKRTPPKHTPIGRIPQETPRGKRFYP